MITTHVYMSRQVMLSHLSCPALLLWWEHSQCHCSLLLQPCTVPSGPSFGGLAKGQFGWDPSSAAGRPARLPDGWRLPGGPVPLRPGPRHGCEQCAPPAQVGSSWITYWCRYIYRWILTDSPCYLAVFLLPKMLISSSTPWILWRNAPSDPT